MKDLTTFPDVVPNELDALFEDPKGWCVITCKTCDYLTLNSASEVRLHRKLHSLKKEPPTCDDLDDDHQNDGYEDFSASQPVKSSSTGLAAYYCDPVIDENDRPEKHSCEDCRLFFNSAEKLAKHVAKKHAKKSEIGEVSEDRDIWLPETTFETATNLTILEDEISFTINSKKDNEKDSQTVVSCTQCQKTFLTMLELTGHMVEEHVVEESDGEEEDNDPDDNQHELDPRLKELMGDMEIRWLQEMKKVKYTNSNVPIEDLTCKICGKVCWSLGYLKYRHMRIVHPESEWNLSCEICGKICKNPEALSSHKYASHKNHANKRPQQRNTRMVDITRARIKEQKLKEEKKNPEKARIKYNKKKNPGRKDIPFVCSYCGYTTHYNEALKKHVARKHESHLEENMKKRIKCTYCDHTTLDRSNMKRHMFTQHEYKLGINTDKVCICPHCTYVTPNRNCYANHLKHVHGGVPWKKRIRKKKNATPASTTHDIGSV